MAKPLILNLCLMLATPLFAHPFASYLDGGFLGVGVSVGGGNVAKNSGDALRSHSIQLGLQIQGGYQKYFIPFLGVSCYGYLAYRYLYMDKFATSVSNINNVNRYSLGVGGNLLINPYSKIRKSPYKSVKIYAYGFFVGVLGLVNIWTTQFANFGTTQLSNNANVDATFGIQARIDSFKLSLGMRVPLINQTRFLVGKEAGGLRFLNNYKSSDIFINFIKIF
ncbi:outer membrane beta-barrel protein [Helicobacter felis]|uniref:Outer membrane protein, Hom family n=3 Tax=Helicobacter felis TaxID=214 RepID=E7A9A1_HELFC|nr:outer membrane beta-barrel protein [Helicobacter felis]CBY82479.1 outer membrane protein, Hom family [Helicobacter felis ATCC 49179]SFZ71110.1 OMP27 [Helicobacter felis]